MIEAITYFMASLGLLTIVFVLGIIGGSVVAMYQLGKHLRKQ